MSDYIDITLSPKEIQNLLDCIDIIPSNHSMCIEKNINTEKVYVSDCTWDEGTKLEITEND